MSLIWDYERIKEISDELSIQFGSEEQAPVLVQVFISPEDLEYVESQRIKLFRHALSGDKICLTLMSYLIVKVAFEKYDDKYWDHFREYMSCSITSTEESKIKKLFFSFIEENGFHLVNEGDKYVNTILFNTGIPKKHADRFFKKMLDEYNQVNGVLSDKTLTHILRNIELKRIDSKPGDEIKAVRMFLGDQTYSSAICKTVLKKIDQSSDSSDDNSTYDLGLLDDQFTNWFKGKQYLEKANINKNYTGLRIDTKDLEVYFDFPAIEVNSYPYKISLEVSDGHPICHTIPVRRKDNKCIAEPYKIKLTNEQFLNGFKISNDIEQVFSMESKSHILFDKNGLLETDLTRGTNYLVYDDSFDPDIDAVSDVEKQFVTIRETRKLNSGESFRIDGEDYCVGLSDPNKIRYNLSRVDSIVTTPDNVRVDCVLKHPEISIESSLSAVVISIFDYDGNRLFKKKISSDNFDHLNIEDIYGNNDSGFYKIMVRFGNIRKDYRYILVSEFSVNSPFSLTSDSGLMSISIDEVKYNVSYGPDEYSVMKNIQINNRVFNFEVKTPIITFKHRSNDVMWQTPSDAVIDRTEINKVIVVSPGLETDGLCMLDFYTRGDKIIGSRFSNIQDGLCRFEIIDVILSLKKYPYLVDCFFNCNGQAFKLFSLRETYTYDVDSVDGACLISVFSMPMNKQLFCKLIIDDKPEEVYQLKKDEFRLVLYDKNVSYAIIEGNSENVIEQNTFGNPAIGNSAFNKYYSIKENDLEVMAEKEIEAAHELGKRCLRSMKFPKAGKYLSVCAFKGYVPAFEDYAQYLFLFGDEKQGMKYLKLAEKNGSETATMLNKLMI